MGVVLQWETRMNAELKQLVEDAAKLLGIDARWIDEWNGFYIHQPHKLPSHWPEFNPSDPERGDLMKVADAAGLYLELRHGNVVTPDGSCIFNFIPHNYQSLTIAVLRAASAVWKARNGNVE